MTMTDASRAARNPEPADMSGKADAPGRGRPEKKPAQQVAREVFEKYHYNGLDGAENSPEIYPVYRTDGRNADGVICEVCGREKEDCVC